MPKSDRTPDPFPSDEQLLAALGRAERHRRHKDQGVQLGAIKAHLNLPRHSGTTRRLRPQLTALEAGGLIEQTRRHSLDLWMLTRRGHQRLDATSGAIALPESPQHQEWREAREAADERIEGFHNALSFTTAEAMQLLDAGSQPSDSWFSLGERLQHACWRLGSATYCLHEWPEPDDSTPDIDEPTTPLQRGRREVQRWDRS